MQEVTIGQFVPYCIPNTPSLINIHGQPGQARKHTSSGAISSWSRSASSSSQVPSPSNSASLDTRRSKLALTRAMSCSDSTVAASIGGCAISTATTRRRQTWALAGAGGVSCACQWAKAHITPNLFHLLAIPKSPTQLSRIMAIISSISTRWQSSTMNSH